MQSVDNPDRLTDWLPGWLAGVIYVYSLFSKSKYPAVISLFISKKKTKPPIEERVPKESSKKNSPHNLGCAHVAWLPLSTWANIQQRLTLMGCWHTHTRTGTKRNEQRPDTFHQILWFDEHCIWDNKKKPYTEEFHEVWMARLYFGGWEVINF